MQKGNTVRLKSGGPLMTIADIRGDFIDCIWFLNEEVKMHSFKSVTLQIDNDDIIM